MQARPGRYNANYMMWRSSILLLTLLTAVGGAQTLSPLDSAESKDPAGPQPPSNALDKQDLEFYVRHLYVYGPQINIVVDDPKPSDVPGLKEIQVTASFQLASKKHSFLVSEDGKHLVEGAVYQIDKNPFHKANETIDTFAAPGFGKEGASVVLVAYSDFQCPYCAEEAKLLRGQLNALYASKVRVYFREFPLEMHNWARDAAVAGRCVFINEPEVFWDFHDWVFENQKTITPENLSGKIKLFLADTTVDAAKFEACFSSRQTEKDIEKSLAEGQSLGVTSTPTLFVNGRKLPGSTKWDSLKAILDYELEYQKVTENAGDDCGCTVELPFPQ